MAKWEIEIKDDGSCDLLRNGRFKLFDVTPEEAKAYIKRKEGRDAAITVREHDGHTHQETAGGRGR